MHLFLTLLMAHTAQSARTVVTKFHATKDGRAAYQALVARVMLVDESEFMRCQKRITEWVFSDAAA